MGAGNQIRVLQLLTTETGFQLPLFSILFCFKIGYFLVLPLYPRLSSNSSSCCRHLLNLGITGEVAAMPGCLSFSVILLVYRGWLPTQVAAENLSIGIADMYHTWVLPSLSFLFCRMEMLISQNSCEDHSEALWGKGWEVMAEKTHYETGHTWNPAQQEDLSLRLN